MSLPRCPVCGFLYNEHTTRPACPTCWQQAHHIAVRALTTLQKGDKPTSKTSQVIYLLTSIDTPTNDIDFLIRDLGYDTNPAALERLLHRAAHQVHTWAQKRATL